MDNNDKIQFQELFNTTSEYYQRPTLSGSALMIYFNALSKFTYQQVEFAVGKHIACGEGGQFYPKVVDLVKFIEGSAITVDQVLAMAMVKTCPLGVLCYMHIGSWSLNNLNSFELKPRAQECIEMLAIWKSKALCGDYSDHEVWTMVAYGVNPCAPLYADCVIPENQEELRKRAADAFNKQENKRIATEKEEQALLAAPKITEEQAKENRERMSAMLKGIIDDI